MTNELEKTFFDTFGIEQKEHKECECDYLNCPNPDIECEECYRYKIYKFDYPQITDHILLELICIVLNTFETFEVNRIMDVDSLKEKILKLSILAKDDVYSQVRTLFEEG